MCELLRDVILSIAPPRSLNRMQLLRNEKTQWTIHIWRIQIKSCRSKIKLFSAIAYNLHGWNFA